MQHQKPPRGSSRLPPLRPLAVEAAEQSTTAAASSERRGKAGDSGASVKPSEWAVTSYSVPPEKSMLLEWQQPRGRLSKVSSWPSSKPRRKLSITPATSKAPLSLQLEAFIRKEHRQYLLEHPNCSRADTIHIFREALNTFMNHFAEYKGVLQLVRDAYDETLVDAVQHVREMRCTDLENRSGLNLHAMELSQLRDSLTSEIHNQRAQLQASQGLVHSLRDRLATAIHDKERLSLEMEQRKQEFNEAQDQVKMLARAMIEESARTAQALDSAKKREREMEVLQARVKSLQENVSELETCLRAQAHARSTFVESPNEPHHLHRQGQVKVESPRRAPFTGPSLVSSPLSTAQAESTHHDEYIHRLLGRIDALQFELAVATGGTTTPAATAGSEPTRRAPSLPERGIVSPLKGARRTTPADAPFPVIREWLRHEGITEESVSPTDFLLPPGDWPGEEFAFLKACEPVKNRHLRRAELLQLLDRLWETREHKTTTTRFQAFFVQWLESETGSTLVAQELGINILHGCQRCLDHPECRGLLAVLRGFLPEDLVLCWRQLLRQLRQGCETSLALVGDDLPVDVFFGTVRAVFPEKPLGNMLQLRFYVFRHYGLTSTVNVATLLGPESYFVVLLKQQFLQEVEAFTLAVVEGIRRVADHPLGTVPLNRAMDVVSQLEPEMGRERLHKLFAEACQRSKVEVALAPDATTVRLQPMLQRFRSAVLLRRTAAALEPDAPESTQT